MPATQQDMVHGLREEALLRVARMEAALAMLGHLSHDRARSELTGAAGAVCDAVAPLGLPEADDEAAWLLARAAAGHTSPASDAVGLMIESCAFLRRQIANQRVTNGRYGRQESSRCYGP